MTNQLKKRIMKRVYAIWFSKKVAPALFLYLPFLLFVALRETANEFFVAKIVDNLLMAFNNGFSTTAKFMLSALSNAPVFPSLIILASLGLFVFLMRRLVKSLRTVRLAKNSV